MTGRDLLEVATRNLWRIKLRAVLTTAGVVIAIATFVAMLSFAAGNQRYFSTAFNEFGLLHRMSVTPRTANAADTTRTAVLDNAAVRALSELPGVRLAYPYSEFDVSAAVMDTVVTTSAQSLPADAVRTALYAKILGGAEAFGRHLAQVGIHNSPRYIQKPAFDCAVLQPSGRFPCRVDRDRLTGTFTALDELLVLPWNEHYTEEHCAAIASEIHGASEACSNP